MYWIPIVDHDVKPIENMEFNMLEEGVKFYERYARLAGFETRKSTLKKGVHGEIKVRVIVCNKEGVPEKKKQDTLDGKKRQQRLVPSCKSNCHAQIRFSLDNEGKYKVYRFVEEHNHCFVPPEDEYLMKSSRKLTFEQQLMIHKAGNVDIGSTNTFKLYKEMSGGYPNVGATRTEFKNFKRDINCYVGDGDAQMMVDKFTKKSTTVSNFHFHYSTKKNGTINTMFWVDEIQVANYVAFGDIISFDATYNTNRYKMVLVPFTGMNNHKKCISFGTGLLSNENVESYVWLLEAFIATHGKEPIVVVTDQDAAMKIAVEKVLKNTIHRYCMWHIMDKLALKVGSALCNKECPFSQRLRDIVWNLNIEPEEFESEWNMIVDEFNVGQNTWLLEMYKIRSQWIPAFFRDIRMAGLMRTTSMSEGQNNFFKNHIKKTSSLVEFFTRYESAMDAQRNMQKTLDYESRTKKLDLITGLDIEKHASQVFTFKIFVKFQEEICKSSFGVLPIDSNEDEKRKMYKLKDVGKDTFIKKPVEIVFIESELNITCTCKLFERVGILCRHVFFVFRLHDINQIPEKYIPQRWTKDIFTVTIAKIQNMREQVEKQKNKSEKLIRDMYADLSYCIQVLRDDDGAIEEASKRHHDLIMELTAGRHKCERSKKDVIKELVGMSQPDEVTVFPPEGIRTKGCGKRLISDRDKAIEEDQRALRMCRICKKPAHHDSRNCPLKNAQL